MFSQAQMTSTEYQLRLIQFLPSISSAENCVGRCCCMLFSCYCVVTLAVSGWGVLRHLAVLLRVTFDPPAQKRREQGEPGSKHHVNYVKVRDLKLNGSVGRPQPLCTTVSRRRAANTSQKSCFGKCCVRTRTFASDTDFFRAKQAVVDGQQRSE